MSAIAPTMQAFFSERLLGQRQASPNTIAAYPNTFRLLLTFVEQQTAKTPSQLHVEHLDADLISAFSITLSTSAPTAPPRATRDWWRSARCFTTPRSGTPSTPTRSRACSRSHPNAAKRPSSRSCATKRSTRCSPRPIATSGPAAADHALLLTMIQSGLRVSELTGLNCADITLTRGPHLRCHGNGRKERVTPLTPQTAQVLRVWRRERAGNPDDPVFPTSRGRRLSRDAVAWLLAKHVATAARACPSLGAKPISPHTLRHTAAMRLLDAGVDITVIALWLGHESTQTTQIYLHADLALKERTLARTAHEHRARALPAPRPAARLLGEPVTMPSD